MPIRVNFSNVASFDIVPAGVYPVVVDSAELVDSKTSEFQNIKVVLVIQEGEHENRKLFSYITLNPKGAFKLREFLAALEICDADDTSEELDFEVEDLIGGELAVLVSETTYNNSPSNSIDKFIHPSEMTAHSVAPKMASGAQKAASAPGRAAPGGTSAQRATQSTGRRGGPVVK